MLGLRGDRAIRPAIPTIAAIPTFSRHRGVEDGLVPCSRISGRMWRGADEDSSGDESEVEDEGVEQKRTPAGRKCGLPLVRAQTLGSPERAGARIRRSVRSPAAPTRPPPFSRIPYAEQVRARPIPPLTNFREFLLQAMQDSPVRVRAEVDDKREHGDFESMAVGPSNGPKTKVSEKPTARLPRETRPNPSLQTLLCGLWSRRGKGGDGGGDPDLGEAAMSGGDGARGNWRGGGGRNFNGGPGWTPPQGQWTEGRGGGRGFYGQPDYGYQEPPPPEFGFGRGAPPQGMPYNMQGQQQWNYQGQGQHFPPLASVGNQQGSGRFDSRGQGHGQGSGQNIAQGGNNTRAPVQQANSAGSANSGLNTARANSNDSSKGGEKAATAANTADSSEVKGPACFRCNLVGHVLKECKTILYCINCGRHEAHISDRCGMLSRPAPVVKLVGCANEGLQMLVAQSGKKGVGDKGNLATGLVMVLEGVLSVEQLEKAMGEQFPWGGKWKVKEYGNNSFLVKFPNVMRLQELCGYPMFGLRGTKAAVKVTKWSPASNAIFKLYSVWVRVSGIPASLLHRDGFAEAASMIGTLQDVDMAGYRKTETIRVKCGVRDPSKIPEVGELTDDPFTYLIYFELEEIVEEGGRMIDGELVRQGDGQKGRKESGEADRTAKRTKNNDAGEEGAGNNTTAVDDVEMVPSSQPDTDKEKEEELRQKMLKKRASNKQHEADGSRDLFMEDVVKSKVCYDDNGILQKLGADSGDGKSTEVSASTSMDDAEDDGDSFARKAGLSTQAIEKIRTEVEEEMQQEEALEKEKLNKDNEELLKDKDTLVDETRRRTGRGNSEQNTMDKAKDRAKMRNLEGPAENKPAKQTTQRSKSVGVGGH